MQRLFLAFVLALSAFSLVACSKQSSPVTITDYGTYDAVILVEGNWKLGKPVAVASVQNLTHKETITKIPAKDGVYWGMRASVKNSSPNPVETYSVTIHPQITSPDGKVSTEEKSPVGTLQPGESVSAECMWFFIDSCPHEFVPGEWSFQIFVDGKLEASKDFEVYKP